MNKEIDQIRVFIENELGKKVIDASNDFNVKTYETYNELVINSDDILICERNVNTESVFKAICDGKNFDNINNTDPYYYVQYKGNYVIMKGFKKHIIKSLTTDLLTYFTCKICNNNIDEDLLRTCECGFTNCLECIFKRFANKLYKCPQCELNI